MTNAGLSLNAELFKRVISSRDTGVVYLIRLNCAQAPPTHMTHTAAIPKVLLLRGVRFDSVGTPVQWAYDKSVPAVFRIIGHRCLDWQSVNPDVWVSLGRHSILVLNEVAGQSSHLSSPSYGLARPIQRLIPVSLGDMELDPCLFCLGGRQNYYDYIISEAYVARMSAIRASAQINSGAKLRYILGVAARTKFPVPLDVYRGIHGDGDDTHRQYVLNEGEALIFRLAVVEKSPPIELECASYILILKWSGIALTCSIVPSENKHLRPAPGFFNNIEGLHSNVAPGPSEETEIRVLIKKETGPESASPSMVSSRFRVILRCENVRQGLVPEDDPPNVHSQSDLESQ